MIRKTTGDEDRIMALVAQNSNALKQIQGSKIRINEFVAKSFISTLEDVQKAAREFELNIALALDNWEKTNMLPSDVYYTSSPYDTCKRFYNELELKLS